CVRMHLNTVLTTKGGAAVRLPAHSIKSRDQPESFCRLPSHTVQSPCDRAPVTNDFSPSRFQWHTLPERMDLSATRERVLATEEILHDGRDCLLQMAKVQFIDSTGVGQLIHLQKQLRAIDRQLVLVAVCPEVQQALKLMRLEEFF